MAILNLLNLLDPKSEKLIGETVVWMLPSEEEKGLERKEQDVGVNIVL